MPSITTTWRLLTRAACACVAVVLALHANPAAAQVGSDRYAAIVVDAATGNVLSAANPDEFRFPASLTKMMTLYMLFEAVRDRRISFDELVPISPEAASMPPTKLGLVPGSRITVEQAVFGLVTRSANDAAAALGELMGGDEERFAEMMTLRARALGMTHTRFRNASGLPDWNQVTTARDMAILARHLIQDFPNDYHYFSTPEFRWGRQIIRTHQHLLQTYPGADGLKTGFTNASGYNVVTSAMRGNVRLIGVVMGASSGGERDANMTMLLDEGFDRMGVAPMLARREPASRMPAFISLAQAAPPRYAPPRYALPRYVPPQYASSRYFPAHYAARGRLPEVHYARGASLAPVSARVERVRAQTGALAGPVSRRGHLAARQPEQAWTRPVAAPFQRRGYQRPTAPAHSTSSARSHHPRYASRLPG